MIDFDGPNWQCVTDQLQSLITRAQNEALEKADHSLVEALRKIEKRAQEIDSNNFFDHGEGLLFQEIEEMAQEALAKHGTKS